MAITFLKDLVPNIESKDIVNAYRMGAPGESKRSILIKFKSLDTKMEIMSKKSTLKDKKKMKNVYCNEDLPERTRKLRQKLREIGRYAIKTGHKYVTGNKIQINGETYYERDLKLLPSDLQIENIKVRPLNGRICFEGEMAYLSSSYHCPIKMGDNLFGSAEQAFFYHMAIYTGRSDYAAEILECDESKTLRKMGKKMEHDKKWEEIRMRMLKGITILKFQQNPTLRDKLMETGEAPLYNCDLDNYWGTGRSMDSKQWDETMLYPGTNALGMVLDDTRQRLMPAGYGLTRPPLDLSPVTNIKPAAEHKSQKTTPMEGVELENGANLTNENLKATNVSEIHGASKVIKGVPHSAQDMAANIVPTTISKVGLPPGANTSVGSIDQDGVLLKLLHKTLGSGDTMVKSTSIQEKMGHENQADGSASSDVALDLDESSSASIESVSRGSSIAGEIVDPGNLTLTDGKLDKNKLSSLSFPSANISRSLEKSFHSMKKGTKKGYIPPLDEGSTHSTPAPVSTIVTKRRTSKRHADQRAKTDALLLELGL